MDVGYSLLIEKVSADNYVACIRSLRPQLMYLLRDSSYIDCFIFGECVIVADVPTIHCKNRGHLMLDIELDFFPW